MIVARDLRQAADPVVFAQQALHFKPDEWQSQVLRSPGKRLLLNCSRQSGKSTTAAIMALHRGLFKTDSLVLLVSPSLRQSGELFRKVTELIALLPIKPRMQEENRLSIKFHNGSRIVSLPGKEETIRGFSGAALIIEDEASRVDDNLYRAVRPMLAVSGGRLVLMSTPFGKRGHYFEAWDSGKEWERQEIPASMCSRISPEFLAQEREALGEWWYEQEYNCKFMESTDSVFSHEVIMRAISSDVKPLFPVVQA
jgi:hypothetical protein